MEIVPNFENTANLGDILNNDTPICIKHPETGGALLILE